MVEDYMNRYNFLSIGAIGNARHHQSRYRPLILESQIREIRGRGYSGDEGTGKRVHLQRLVADVILIAPIICIAFAQCMRYGLRLTAILPGEQ